MLGINLRFYLFLVQSHPYRLKRAFGGTDSATFAVIVVDHGFGFRVAAHRVNRDNPFRTEPGADSATGAFIKIHLWLKSPPGAGFIFFR